MAYCVSLGPFLRLDRLAIIGNGQEDIKRQKGVSREENKKEKTLTEWNMMFCLVQRTSLNLHFTFPAYLILNCFVNLGILIFRISSHIWIFPKGNESLFGGIKWFPIVQEVFPRFSLIIAVNCTHITSVFRTSIYLVT